MGEPSATRTVRVANARGLHLRVASEIAKAANRYEAEVHLIKENHRVDVGEVIEILALCAAANDELVIEATGAEAEAVLDELVTLFETDFSEASQEIPKE